jgi:hypothetical protein
MEKRWGMHERIMKAAFDRLDEIAATGGLAGVDGGRA